MSALRLIKEVNVTGSTSILDVQDVFSDDFDVYKITYTNFSTVGTTATALDLRLNEIAGGTMVVTSYDYCYMNMKAEDAYAQVRGTTTFFDNFFGVVDQSPETNGGVFYIFSPTSTSHQKFIINENSSFSSGLLRAYKYSGCLKELRKVTGFRIFEQNTRPFNSGTVRVYGLRVDS